MKNFFFVISFQDPATVFSYHLIAVHNDIFWFILIILVFVYWCLYKIIKEFGWEVFNKRSFLIKYISSFVQTHYLFVTWTLYRVRTVRLILPMYYSLVALAIDRHLLLKENDIISFLIFKIFRVVFLQIGDVYFKGMDFPYEIELLELKDVEELQNRQSIATKLFYESTWARLLGDLTRNVLYSLRFRKNMLLEYIYSIVPTAIIIWILMPSFVLLYSLDEAIDPLLTIKVEGHQWFWHYEFSNFIAVNDDKEEILKIVDEAAKVYNAYLNGDEKALESDLSDFWSLNNRVSSYKEISYDSILVSDQDLPFGSKRLLTVDKPLFVPMDISIRFLISSADVLHAWSVPEFGLKIDAVPGRLNQFITMVCKPGVYYGQCSELCGVAHGYMPIQVIAVSLHDWLNFIENIEKLNYV